MFQAVALARILTFVVAAAAIDPEAAKTYYEAGRLSYERDRIEEALDAFQKAYDYQPAPGLLFNIGQCHRRLGRDEQALDFFRRYLRELPGAPNRKLVEELIAEIESRQSSSQPTTVAIATPPAAATTRPAVAPTTASAAPGLTSADQIASSAPAVSAANAAAPARPLHWGWIAAGAGASAALLAGLGAGVIESIFTFSALGSGEERLTMQFGERLLLGVTALGLAAGAAGAAVALVSSADLAKEGG